MANGEFYGQGFELTVAANPAAYWCKVPAKRQVEDRRPVSSMNRASAAAELPRRAVSRVTPSVLLPNTSVRDRAGTCAPQK